MPRFATGDDVHTPLGRGIVREVRTGGRLLVDVAGRKVVIESGSVKPAEPSRSSARKRIPLPPRAHGAVATGNDRGAAEIDLHGLFVADALARVEVAINDALLAGRLQLRVIHGRGGGRIKAAIHHQLRALPPVRGFRLDPLNAGVTIVDF